MQSDSICTVERLSAYEARVNELSDRSVRVRALRDRWADRTSELSSEVSRLEEEESLLRKVNELFQALIDLLVMDQVRAISSVVSEGLKTIFWDHDLSFEAELGQKYNKVCVDLYLCSGDPANGGIKDSPLEAFGGGPASITSLLLRVLTLLRLKKYPILLLDETLASVADFYIEATGEFLQKLCKVSGLDILMITHKSSFIEHSDSAYQGDSLPADPDAGKAMPSFVAKKLRSR